METQVRLSKKVDLYQKTFGDHLVRIYNSNTNEVITFFSNGQEIKVYKALVQTVVDGKEDELMGIYEQLSKDQIEQQFNLIEQNVKKYNSLYSEEQPVDQGSSKSPIQGAFTFLQRYFRGFGK